VEVYYDEDDQAFLPEDEKRAALDNQVILVTSLDEREIAQVLGEDQQEADTRDENNESE
jgi:hypothetical protein